MHSLPKFRIIILRALISLWPQKTGNLHKYSGLCLGMRENYSDTRGSEFLQEFNSAT